MAISNYQDLSSGLINKNLEMEEINLQIIESNKTITLQLKLYEKDRYVIQKFRTYLLIDCPTTRYKHYLRISENNDLDYSIDLLYDRILNELFISIISFDNNKQMRDHSFIYKFKIGEPEGLDIKFRFISFSSDENENKCKSKNDLFWYMECPSSNRVTLHLNSDIPNFERFMTVGLSTLAGFALKSVIQMGIRIMYRMALEYDLIKYLSSSDDFKSFSDDFIEDIQPNNTYFSQFPSQIVNIIEEKKKKAYPWVINNEENPWLFYSDYCQRTLLGQLNKIIVKGMKEIK